MTEFDFIRRYLKKQQNDAQVVLGIGDDAAIIRPQAGFDLCFSSDMLLKGRHFLRMFSLMIWLGKYLRSIFPIWLQWGLLRVGFY